MGRRDQRVWHEDGWRGFVLDAGILCISDDANHRNVRVCSRRQEHLRPRRLPQKIYADAFSDRTLTARPKFRSSGIDQGKVVGMRDLAFSQDTATL